MLVAERNDGHGSLRRRNGWRDDPASGDDVSFVEQVAQRAHAHGGGCRRVFRHVPDVYR